MTITMIGNGSIHRRPAGHRVAGFAGWAAGWRVSERVRRSVPREDEEAPAQPGPAGCAAVSLVTRESAVHTASAQRRQWSCWAVRSRYLGTTSRGEHGTAPAMASWLLALALLALPGSSYAFGRTWSGGFSSKYDLRYLPPSALPGR